MTLAKRIIPCLDVSSQGRVVKGTGFKKLMDAGDPVERASYYDKEGADEIVFLDISASHENRDTLLEVVRKTAEVVFIPLTVGGGIRSVEDVRRILASGADKVSINTAAVKDPDVIRRCSEVFGSQCIVYSIDIERVYTEEKDEDLGGKTVLRTEEGECWWRIRIYGGRKPVDLDAFEWAEHVVGEGAGEVLVSSLDYDGTGKGYDIPFLRELSRRVRVPIVASSGVGRLEHILSAFKEGNADAALAASIFHYGKYSIRDVKKYLSEHGVEVRL